MAWHQGDRPLKSVLNFIDAHPARPSDDIIHRALSSICFPSVPLLSIATECASSKYINIATVAEMFDRHTSKLIVSVPKLRAHIEQLRAGNSPTTDYVISDHVFATPEFNWYA
jgi:hypothetical protein